MTRTTDTIQHSATHYEVQHQMLGGWQNTWSTDDKPVTFATQAEAETALADFLADSAEAERNGDAIDYDPTQWRVAEVGATTAPRIAALNDLCRTKLGRAPNCRLLMTAGFNAAFRLEAQLHILQRVASFSEFTADNDPHGEHDFGAFEFKGQRIFWKIDYYALDLDSGSEDPADPTQTVRVLTILMAEEY